MSSLDAIVYAYAVRHWPDARWTWYPNRDYYYREFRKEVQRRILQPNKK